MDQSEFENENLKPASEVTTFFPPLEIHPRKKKKSLFFSFILS